jgi:hypothetical protein
MSTIHALSPENLVFQLDGLFRQGWWFSRLNENGLQVDGKDGISLGDVDVHYHGAECRWDDCTVTDITKLFRSDQLLFAICYKEQFIGMVHFLGHSSSGHVWNVSTPGTLLRALSVEQIDAKCWPKADEPQTDYAPAIGKLLLAMQDNGLTPIAQYSTSENGNQITIGTMVDGVAAYIGYNLVKELFAVVIRGKVDFGTDLAEALEQARSHMTPPTLAFMYDLNELLRKHNATISVNVARESHGLYDLELMIMVGDAPVHTETMYAARVLSISADSL